MSRKSQDQHVYNVGVIGKAGAGKSTFINAFFGFPQNAEYAAKNDVVECTQKSEPYHVPGSDVILWDVPGFGTQSFKDDKNYIKLINLKRYDFYLLISRGKMDEFEMLLHNEIAKQGKRYFYIRTNFDNELRNEQRAHRSTFSEEETKDKIQNQITRLFSDVPVYFVDSLKPHLYDFPNMPLIVKEGARFSKSSHRDVQQRGEYFHEKPKTKESKCIIQ